MRPFPIAARDLVALMGHVGPIQQIGGVTSDLIVLTRYPNVLWLCTHVPWRVALERLRAAGAVQGSQQGYLLPYIEQDALYRLGYGYVRMGTFSVPNPPVRGISDGTSNTILIGDGSVRVVGPAGGGLSSGRPRTTTIQDGTSNTILVGERNTVGFGDGSVRTISPSITDGTSNTILIGEEDPPPPGGGSDTNVIIGGDVGVNLGPPGSAPNRQVVVHRCA